MGCQWSKVDRMLWIGDSCELSSIKMWPICVCLHCQEVCTHFYTMQAGSLGNMNSIIEGMYQEITCGLIQSWRILTVWGGGGGITEG